MIEIMKEHESDALKQIINDDYLQNVYLSIDVTAYGFFGESITSYLLRSNGEIYALIYVYHNSVQLFQMRKISQEQGLELVAFLRELKIKRISGCTSIIEVMHKCCNDTSVMTTGHIMRFVAEPTSIEEGCFFAKREDYEDITALIMTDKHMGYGYQKDDLQRQLTERAQAGCENMCIRVDNRIVSHFATYAVSQNCAVLSGMVTEEVYRGRGYGGKLVRSLSSYVKQQGRTPIIYCYTDEYYTWYQKLGYTSVCPCAKLELALPSSNWQG